MHDELEQQLIELGKQVGPDPSWVSSAKADLLLRVAELVPGTAAGAAATHAAFQWTAAQVGLAAAGAAVAVGLGVAVYTLEQSEVPVEKQGAAAAEAVSSSTEESIDIEAEAKEPAFLPSAVAPMNVSSATKPIETSINEGITTEKEKTDDNGLHVGEVEDRPNESVLPWGKTDKKKSLR